MPLPTRYRKPVDDLFAGRITGKELREMIERIDNVQMSLGFMSGVSSRECRANIGHTLRREQICLARYGEVSRALEN